MASPEFCYNVAYTVKANEGATPENRLSRQELWQGIKRGGRYPGDFADFVRSCEVLSGKRNQFVREIVIGDGAVHTKDGTKIVQDVFIQDDLFIAATTRENGAKSTLIVAYGAATEFEKEEEDPFLTVFYELKMGDKSPAPGSEEAKAIVTNYRNLAKTVCNDAIDHIRQWKVEGKLAQWADDEKKGIW